MATAAPLLGVGGLAYRLDRTASPRPKESIQKGQTSLGIARIQPRGLVKEYFQSFEGLPLLVALLETLGSRVERFWRNGVFLNS